MVIFRCFGFNEDTRAFISILAYMKPQPKNLMLFDVEEGNNLISTRLTPVATLIDTKKQSATTSFSTQIVTFS